MHLVHLAHSVLRLRVIFSSTFITSSSFRACSFTPGPRLRNPPTAALEPTRQSAVLGYDYIRVLLGASETGHMARGGHKGTFFKARLFQKYSLRLEQSSSAIRSRSTETWSAMLRRD